MIDQTKDENHPEYRHCDICGKEEWGDCQGWVSWLDYNFCSDKCYQEWYDNWYCFEAGE